MTLSDSLELFGLEIFELELIKKEYSAYFDDLFDKVDEKLKILQKVQTFSLEEAVNGNYDNQLIKHFDSKKKSTSKSAYEKAI